MRLLKVTLPIALAALISFGAVNIGCVFADPDPTAGDASPDTSAPANDRDAHLQSGKKTVDHGQLVKHFSKPYGSHLGPILDRIKANPEQRRKITVIVESFRSTLEPLRDQYREKQQEFIQSMTTGATDEAIMSSQVELAHLSSQISSNYMLMRIQVRRLLTPQQVVQFEAYRKEHGWTHAQ
jgi:Spy/CpxP family protein refolding chaperone